MSQLFPQRPPAQQGRPSNNPTRTRVILGPTTDALRLRSFNRPLDLIDPAPVTPTAFSGAASGEQFFRPQERS